LKLLTTGFPKHGNHPLVKACELLGVPAQVEHRPFAEGLPEGTTHHIFIKRNPKNAAVAMLRMRGLEELPGYFLTYFRRTGEGAEGLVAEMEKFEGWLTHPGTLVVRYEDLIASDAEMRRIAQYLGVPYLDGAFEHLPGLTVTWTGPNHSDYRSLWTPEVQSAWTAEGGDELMARWGY